MLANPSKNHIFFFRSAGLFHSVGQSGSPKFF